MRVYVSFLYTVVYFNFNPLIGIFGDLEYQIDPKVVNLFDQLAYSLIN